MDFKIDIKRLRRDLEDYYGTAMFSGFPVAMMDLTKVQKASEEELVALAQESHIDLTKYMI